MTTDHHTLLKRHQARVTALANGDDRFVANKDWKAFSSGDRPKLITIADNPGAKEYKFHEYFSSHGRAGKRARAFFDGVFGAGSFGRDVLPLNKSSFYTKRTGGLTAVLSEESNSENAEAIRADMRENGKLVVRLVAALQVPALFIGRETDDTFGAFREGFNDELTKVKKVSAFFAGRQVDPNSMIPHFSLCWAFRKSADTAWNDRIDAFIKRWKHVGRLTTKKGNLSSKRMLDLANKAMLTDYLVSVMFGASNQ